MDFKDHFSDRAALYAAHRPVYPPHLFEELAKLTATHDLALDCGTGNGQAAQGLADHFRRIIAIDPSAEQIRKASPHPKIDYRVSRAEQTDLEGESVDLVTAAQALHWFEPRAFFAEVKRVLRPGGAIAVWGYGDPILDTITLHNTLREFNRGKLEPYWTPERSILLDGYRGLAFPFREVSLPALELEVSWTLLELIGYLRTWSAVARYASETGRDVVAEVEPALAAGWGEPSTQRRVRWPLYVRAGLSTA